MDPASRFHQRIIFLSYHNIHASLPASEIMSTCITWITCLRWWMMPGHSQLWNTDIDPWHNSEPAPDTWVRFTTDWWKCENVCFWRISRLSLLRSAPGGERKCSNNRFLNCLVTKYYINISKNTTTFLSFIWYWKCCFISNNSVCWIQYCILCADQSRYILWIVSIKFMNIGYWEESAKVIFYN